MISSIVVIDLPWIKVAIKVIRSAFTAEEVKQFNQVGELSRCGRLGQGFKKYRSHARNCFEKRGFGPHWITTISYRSSES